MQKKSENKIINWGIIGLGNIAHKFAQDLVTIPNAKLYAVASRSQNKADEFAEQYKAVRAYDSYEALAKDQDIDAVYIATPHALHMDNTMLCLEYGIPVLCEKPFAMNSDEVKIMISKAKDKNVLLMEALWTYFLPHYQHVLDLLHNQTYGKIMKLEADFGFYRPFDNSARLFKKSLGGGSLLDIGIYPIFAALSTLGIPQKINASATFFENGADSSCNITFDYDQDKQAFLKSTLIEDTPIEAQFFCEHAIIKINSGWHGPSIVSIIQNGNEETLDFGYNTNGYYYEILHFNDLIRQDKKESSIMTFEFSRQLIKLLDEVREIIKLEY